MSPLLLLVLAVLCRRLAQSMGIRALRPPVLRQGVVLVTQPGEHNHFLYEQAVFLYEFGERGSKGVILERPTAFSMGEISPGNPISLSPLMRLIPSSAGMGVFEGNTLFMGSPTGFESIAHPL